MEPYPGFRLSQRIGSGGFAEVWQAVSREGHPVALKFLPCDNGPDSVSELRSIQTIRKLQHPNLIRMYRVWGHEGYNVVAMEQAEGSLGDLLEVYQSEFGGPVPGPQVCVYLAQAAAALDFLNTRQHEIDGQLVAIQHCDVKPSNLMLFGETVKLSDFGLASVISSQVKFHRRAGTLAYTAPEVFQGRLSDWTDQYALAVSYCELRGGRLPFPHNPRGFRSDYVRPAPDLSMLPPAEQPAVARALSPVPHDRWPTCTQLIEELSAVVT